MSRPPLSYPDVDLEATRRLTLELRERALYEESAADPRGRTVTWQDLIDLGLITDAQLPE